MIFGPLKDDHGELVIIGRAEAAQQGRTFFYTGKACRKRNHMSVRYVSNGCCKACLNQTFKPKINAWTNKLVLFLNNNLWTCADFTKAERIALRVYLQHCIFEFIRKNRASKDLNYRAELETAMGEIERRGKFATQDDLRNTD